MPCPTGGNSKRLDFSSYPQLENAGGSVAFQGSGYSDPNCGQPDIIVVAHGGGSFTALSASCSHQCCTATLSGSQIRCPCHGATWNLNGTWTGGHSAQALESLKVCADANGVTVSW